MNRFSRLGALCVLVTALSIPAMAQSTAGAILGDITDSTGARLPGVVVKALNEATGAARETVTNELGSYRLPALQPATYTVTAELSGFRTSQQKVAVPISSNVTVDIRLEVASVSESVTVSELAPLVETTETAVKTLISNQQIQELPLKSRNFMDLALLSPGVVMDQSAAAGGQVTPISFGAMDARYKSIWLEGVDFNDEVTSGGSSLSDPTRIQLAQEAIQEFQVMANSYSTEFGRSASGVINIVSKTGTNSLHGNVFYFLRNDSISKPPFNVQAGSAGSAAIVSPLNPEPVFKIQQYGGTVGGPLKKDKAHFFFSYERQRSDRTVTVNIPTAIRSFVAGLGYDTETAVPISTTVNNYIGKLTFALHPQHTLNVTYLYDDRDLPNQQVNASSARDHGYNDIRAAYFLVGNLTSLLGSSTVNELRFSRSIQKLNRGVPGKAMPQLTFPTVSFGQATNIPQSRNQYNWVLVDTVSRHFTGFFGEHDVKFGGQMNRVYATGRINNSFNGNFTFLQDRPVLPNDPNCAAATFNPTACSLPVQYQQGIDLRNNNALIDRSLNIFYLFANDSWRITPRVTMNLGLRWDYQQWAGDLVGEPYPSGVPEQQFWTRMIVGDLRGRNFTALPEQKTNYSPRVGLTWDVTGNGMTVLRAGWGIYYDRVNTTTLRSVIDGYNGFTTSAVANDSRTTRIPNTFFPNVPGPGVLSAAGGSTFRVPNPAGLDPYTQQSTIGVQHQFANSWAVSTDYVRTFGLHFQQTRNVNAPINGVFPLTPNLRILLLDNSGIIKINQWQARLAGRLARTTLNFGYTLASAKADADTPQDAYQMHDFGYTNNDVRHRLTSNVLYDLPGGVQLGTIVTFNTAAPYNTTLGAANRNDVTSAGFALREAGVPFNAGRGDEFFTLDLRTSKKFNFGERAGVEVLWEMFNIFNTQNLISYNGNQLAATRNQPRAALDAFQAQFGLKFSF